MRHRGFGCSLKIGGVVAPVVLQLLLYGGATSNTLKWGLSYGKCKVTLQLRGATG